VAERKDALELAVGDVMTYGAVTARPELSVSEAAALLVRFRIGCLPVVDDAGKVTGIFSETDALHALVSGPSASPRSRVGRVLDLELLVAELRAERARIAKQLAALQDAERESAREEPARGFSDRTSDEPLASLAARRLAAIGHALERAAHGRLGRCESCGAEIPITRLRAVPGTSLCRSCVAKDESAGAAR